MRRMNVPDLIVAGERALPSMTWALYDECYPSVIPVSLDITTHPDPFSPGTQRVCHHANVQLYGLGVVELGWCVVGEPPMESPVADVHIDPVFVAQLVEGFQFVPGPTRPAGQGVYDAMWSRLSLVVTLTMLGLAVKVCQDSTRHRATDQFLRRMSQARYHQNGMLRQYREFVPFDLATIDLV